MQKTTIILLLCLALLLAGCGTAATTEEASTTPQSTAAASGSLDTTSANALPAEEQLLIGTMKLEGTDQAVTTAQASVLLPLWQQLQALNGGSIPPMGQGASATPTPSASTDSKAQVDALVAQIQAAMTAKQIQAIAAMGLTQESVMSLMQSQGMGPGGQPPQGNPPGGSGQAPQGTPPAAPSGNGQMPLPGGSMGGLPPQMFDTLIQLLQNRINGTSSTTGTSGGMVNPGGNTSAEVTPASAAYSLDGQTDTQSGQTYTANDQDESAVYVSNGGNLTLTDSIIISTGNTSSTDSSSFYGLNAAMLAASGGTINLSNSQVKTSGTGANGVFATGNGSSVTLSNLKIAATGDGGHAVMATQGGTLTVTEVDMTTSGASASAIATDRGGGTITVHGGTVQTSGMNSAGIYSTGNIKVEGTTFTSSGAEAAVIEGANSITLTNADLTSTKAGKWGVMIYQSMSGDAQGTRGTFSMTGGSLAYIATDGPLFYVTNSTGVITLKGVDLTAGSGVLVKAAAGNWGNSGSNGGNVILTADGQVMQGDLIADKISSIELSLQNNSSLEGAVNASGTAKSASLSLDATSSWTVTADSTLAVLKDADGITGTTITNIHGNGHTVYYDASLAENSYLGGKTYNLAGGGLLEPLQ